MTRQYATQVRTPALHAIFNPGAIYGCAFVPALHIGGSCQQNKSKQKYCCSQIYWTCSRSTHNRARVCYLLIDNSLFIYRMYVIATDYVIISRGQEAICQEFVEWHCSNMFFPPPLFFPSNFFFNQWESERDENRSGWYSRPCPRIIKWGAQLGLGKLV